MQKIDFSAHSFHPVVALPPDYEVYDLTVGYHFPLRGTNSPFGIGRYNEKRPNIYSSELFGGTRDIHMGIDIAAPVGTEVRAFYPGEIYLFGYNGAVGDYGYTLITKHVLDEIELYALFGHLDAGSNEGKQCGDRFEAGDVIARMGDRHENGGWSPHLHFQLSYVRPDVPDFPGVVADADLAQALETYPDPRLVLGALY